MVCDTGGSMDFGNMPDYDLVEGVSIDVWVFPTDPNRPMTLVSKGESYGIRLKGGRSGPVVECYLRLAEDKDNITKSRGAEVRFEVPEYPLVLNRWNRIVFSYARSGASIAIDSWGTGAVERYPNATTKKEELEESRRILPDDDANLVVGGAGNLVLGRVDDLKVAGIIAGTRLPLPERVTLVGDKVRRIRFRNGRLDPDFHRGEETITILYEDIPSEITIGVLGNILRK
jgi:hypothetical protein